MCSYTTLFALECVQGAFTFSFLLNLKTNALYIFFSSFTFIAITRRQNKQTRLNVQVIRPIYRDIRGLLDPRCLTWSQSSIDLNLKVTKYSPLQSYVVTGEDWGMDVSRSPSAVNVTAVTTVLGSLEEWESLRFTTGTGSPLSEPHKSDQAALEPPGSLLPESPL